MDIEKYKIVLASKSPRRSQLLREAGFKFEMKTLDVDESFPDDLDRAEVAAYIARKKASAAKDLIKDDEILLTADTIVVLENQIYEKPKDREDAIRILSDLSGKVHQVITGVCLLSKGKEQVFSEVADVHLAPLSQAEIEYYIDTYKPYDKAGAYAIQEWIGHCKITKIEGTYTNIMGLPVHRIYEALEGF